MDTRSDTDASKRQALLQARRKSALRRAGITQAELAARIGVSRQSVGLVLVDHHRSRRVEQAIADACGIGVDELFPPDRPVGSPMPEPELSHPELAATAVGRPPEVPSDVTGSQRFEVHDLESRVTSDLDRIARELFLGIVDGVVSRDRPAVRAVAAAIRELHH